VIFAALAHGFRVTMRWLRTDAAGWQSWFPHVRRSRRKGEPGARSLRARRAVSRRITIGATPKRLQVVLDEKSPTYAPPTFTRVTPAELLSAAGDE
jgi:hypothetical protein